MSFDKVWSRIREKTNIKTLVELSKKLETSQPNVSLKKKEGNFPAEWAFKIAQKYGLSTDWILTGEGQQEETITKNPLHGHLADWIREREKDDPSFFVNFSQECLIHFPDFQEWVKNKTLLAEKSNQRWKVGK